jgi:DNA helicase-2/ATP-dependent DNA helicase PcrA
LLCNPRDEAAFLRIVNMPRRGIGDVTLHQVHDICRAQRCSLGKGLSILLSNGTAPAQADKGIRQFLGLMKTYRLRFREQAQPLHEILQDLVLAIDYFGELERMSKTKEHAISRWQNVEHVIRAVQDYEADLMNPSLSDFLDQSHLNSNSEAPSKEERKNTGVSLMTIHSAKGLEFPYVFIAGVEDGILPHDKSIKENSLEEERRLFYVALTRGKRHVVLLETLIRNQRGKERLSKTSRFIREIPEHLLNQRIMAARDMAEAALGAASPPPRKPKPRRKRHG